jgi:AcrR family transcriptional regulator
MGGSRKPQISSRKVPQQVRSTRLVVAILQAATQVLEKEGAQRFTSARVAERAGVSVGSVYQYFPNKASILFRLQCDEWRETSALLRSILENGSQAPLPRLRSLVHAFIRSECAEAKLRVALRAAAPLYRDAPEALEVRASGARAVEVFMRSALPRASRATRSLAGQLMMSTLSAVGQQFSERARSPTEVATYADATADMLCAYLQSLS